MTRNAVLANCGKIAPEFHSLHRARTGCGQPAGASASVSARVDLHDPRLPHAVDERATAHDRHLCVTTVDELVSNLAREHADIAATRAAAGANVNDVFVRWRDGRRSWCGNQRLRGDRGRRPVGGRGCGFGGGLIEGLLRQDPLRECACAFRVHVSSLTERKALHTAGPDGRAPTIGLVCLVEGSGVHGPVVGWPHNRPAKRFLDEPDEQDDDQNNQENGA